MINLDDFIEYAKVIRKYRPILKEYNYYINIEDDFLSLCNSCYSDCILIAERNKINFTPIELDEYIKKVLIREKNNEIIQKMKDLQEEQKRLEILLKTIDNAN